MKLGYFGTRPQRTIPADVMDASGKVATLIGGPEGGEIGAALPYITKEEPALKEIKNLDCCNCPAYTFLRKKQGRPFA